MWSRRAKDFIAGLFASVWATLFGLLGRLWPRDVPRLKSEGGQDVWVLAPHPDDEVIGCAFAMLRQDRKSVV